MTESNWDEERAAAEIVAVQLGSMEPPVKRDIPGALPGTHDYDVLLDHRVIALEVTSARDPEVRAFWNTVQGQEWEEPSLSRSWGLTLQAGTKNKGLPSQVAPHLRTLEIEGVDRFDRRYPSRRASVEVRNVEAKLFGLGIANGISIESQPSRIVISVVGPSGWGSRDTLIVLAEDAARRKADQLARANADQRHVFLWLDWSDHNAQAAMHMVMDLGLLPTRPPQLPPEVDRIWLMPFATADGRARPLLSATEQGWEIIERGEERVVERPGTVEDGSD